MVRVALTPMKKDKYRISNPKITIPSHQQIRVMGIRRTLEKCLRFAKALGTILMTVTPNNWLR
jgi:hypothetical protein